MKKISPYQRGFLPYALSAFLVGTVGGFSTVLGPAFVRDMGISYNNTTWTALAQAMSSAACAPILGKAGDAIGRKTTLLLGIAVFTLGNILSAMASSLAFMLVARFIVGIGTAAIAPVILAYIVTQFPSERVARGLSLYMLISSASVIFGPTLGGLIVNAYGWRVLLWVCVAICAAVFASCLLTGKDETEKKSDLRAFDTVGAVLVLIFFSLVLCIPSFGQNFGWSSAAFLFVLFAAVISLAGLTAVERRAVQPILPGGFMRRREFILSIAALFLTQGLMQANMTNTIVFVDHTHSDGSAVSGYAISVMYLGMSLGALLLGPLADRTEPKKVLACSLMLTLIGCCLQFLFSDSTSALLLMASLGILGFGLGGNGTIFMKVALSGLSQQEAGAATGTYGLFRDLSAPFGVAVFVPLFTNRISAQVAVGTDAASASVRAIHLLAAAESLCIAAGLAVVFCLPKIHVKGETT